MKEIDKFHPNFARNAVIAVVLIAGLLALLTFVQGANDAAERAIQTASTQRTAK